MTKFVIPCWNFEDAAQKKTGTQGPGSLVGLARVAAPGESGWISGRDLRRYYNFNPLVGRDLRRSYISIRRSDVNRDSRICGW